jgi:CheY-like chemotaxis protein
MISESLDSVALGENEGSEWVRSPKLVLVLSPDPNAGQLVEGFVDGYRVVAASRADVAAQHLANLLPYALIVDKTIATTPEVKSLTHTLPYDLPVIVFNLSGGPAQMRELPAGVHGHLIKPVRRGDLVAAIQNLAGPVRSLLIVDDDPAMARFVSLALAAYQKATPTVHQPIRLVSALTGQEALAHLGWPVTEQARDGNGERPDAILLDLNLPDMSGWDVLTALQENPAWRAIPVILVTAVDLRQAMDFY